MTICFKRYYNNYGLIYQSLEHLCHSYWKNWGTCTYHRDFGSFLLSMSINNNEVSFLQVMAGNRCCKSYLEHSCSTKYFSNMQAQNYFYGIMSQFDHQFCDEESRLGKSKTFYFVKNLYYVDIFENFWICHMYLRSGMCPWLGNHLRLFEIRAIVVSCDYS